MKKVCLTSGREKVFEKIFFFTEKSTMALEGQNFNIETVEFLNLKVEY